MDVQSFLSLWVHSSEERVQQQEEGNSNEAERAKKYTARLQNNMYKAKTNNTY
jgi:hypothetical protein